LNVGVGEGVGVGEAVTVGAGLGDEVGVTEGVGVTFTEIFEPLFHTNFLPDLTQVYLVVPTTAVEPAFEQVMPGFTAAFEMPAPKATKINMARINLRKRFIE
jgi:hypothetical protein